MSVTKKFNEIKKSTSSIQHTLTLKYFNGVCYKSFFESVLRVSLHSKEQRLFKSTTGKLDEQELEWK
ncbi:16564_t:CDS:2, partial [Funneliformis geosporum]